MAKKTLKGTFVPKNPEKYIGGNIKNIQYRSGWEHSMMMFLDNGHPNILGWASESISIPYQNPLTGRWSMYIPDFVVVYIDKNNRQHCDVIEVKPLKETPGFQQKKLTEHAKLTQAINASKWKAATQYCTKRGWNFRVATEKDLFAYERRK